MDHHHSILDHIPTAIRGLLDLTSLGLGVATLLDHLPSVAWLFTIVWTAIRIIETVTVQNWLVRIRTVTRSETYGETPENGPRAEEDRD